jgi:hypothetical protein
MKIINNINMTKRTSDIDLYGRYGLFHEEIDYQLNIKNDEKVDIHDRIVNKDKNIELVCVGKDTYILIINNSRDFVTGFDLCLTYEKI